MKKIFLSLLLASVATFVVADIQEPPASLDGPMRKLSRAVANLVYGVSEIPSTWSRTLDTDGVKAAGSYGLLKGTQRTVSRVGYGLYELFTFPVPTYKNGYGEPYHKKQWMYPTLGYGEFPPQLGFSSEADYCRVQSN